MVRILVYGKPFFGNLARILGRVKGFAWRVHPGGGLVSCRFRPVSSCRGPCFVSLLSLSTFAACVPSCVLWGFRPVGLFHRQKSGFCTPARAFVLVWASVARLGLVYIACVRTLSRWGQRAKFLHTFCLSFVAVEFSTLRR